jgi:predicted nucleotidyltransferase
MTGLVIIFCVTTFWLLYNIGKNENDRKQTLKDMEHRFLLAMIHTETYKFQSLEVLKIAYEKAGESDPQFIKDYEKICEVTEKKFEQFGDQWIEHMNNTLGYKTDYQNWKEATRYIEKLVKTNGIENRPTERH